MTAELCKAVLELTEQLNEVKDRIDAPDLVGAVERVIGKASIERKRTCLRLRLPKIHAAPLGQIESVLAYLQQRSRPV
jgi:hypothetical protein